MGQPAAYRHYYDSQAGSYDAFASGDGWTPNIYLADVLAPIAASGQPVRAALDLGTGTGQSLAVVRDLFPSADLTGVDVSPAMLARAAAKVPSAVLEVGDLTGYAQRPDRSVDLVTAIGCAELVADLPLALRALAGRIRGGGHLALTVEVVIDGLGVDLLTPDPIGREVDADGTVRLHHNWTVVEVLAALPGARLVAVRLFRAYRRAGQDVFYELMLLRLPADP